MNYMRLRLALNIFQGLILAYAVTRLVCLPFVYLCLEYRAEGMFTPSMILCTGFYWILGWYLIGPVRKIIKNGMITLECRQKQAEILARCVVEN